MQRANFAEIMVAGCVATLLVWIAVSAVEIAGPFAIFPLVPFGIIGALRAL
jgi:hypothetical protein